MCLTSCAGIDFLNPQARPDAARIENTVKYSKGCEWVDKMEPPLLAVDALEAAYNQAASENQDAADDLLTFAARLAAHDIKWTNNCGDKNEQ